MVDSITSGHENDEFSNHFELNSCLKAGKSGVAALGALDSFLRALRSKARQNDRNGLRRSVRDRSLHAGPQAERKAVGSKLLNLVVHKRVGRLAGDFMTTLLKKRRSPNNSLGNTGLYLLIPIPLVYRKESDF